MYKYIYVYIYIYIYKYIKKLLWIFKLCIKEILLIYILNINSKRNPLVNEVNWNILVTSGKEIKRDSMSNVNESREAYKNQNQVKKVWILWGTFLKG